MGPWPVKYNVNVNVNVNGLDWGMSPHEGKGRNGGCRSGWAHGLSSVNVNVNVFTEVPSLLVL